MAVIARSYSGCKPIKSIVSRESIAVTPHPLKLAVLYVSECGRIEGILSSLVDTTIRYRKEFIARESEVLITMVGMQESVLYLKSSAFPDFWSF
jgi:hypothetical protein